MPTLQQNTTPFPYHNPNSNLPPPHNGRRYPHEIPNPTPIPKNIRRDVLKLLRKYFDAVKANGFTMSESSRTSAPAYSEASTTTSITEMSFNFSMTSGTVQREPEKKRLEDVQRTRKALMRKLEACPEDCRARKVKCKLWHHALRELLEVSQNPEDEAIVEWALKLDAEPENPRTETTVSARVASLVAGGPSESLDVVVDRVNNVLDMSSAIPTLYGSDILETDATLLGRYGRDSPRPPMSSFSTATENGPLPICYSTLWQEGMFCFGLEIVGSGTAQYACQFLGCTEILPAQPLALHYESEHHRFEYLQDPFRMFCQHCDHFHNQRTDLCLQCNRSDIVEAVFGRFIFPMDGQDGMILGGISDYAPFGNQYQSFSGTTGSNSFMHGIGGFGRHGNYWTGQASTPGGSGYSYTTRIANHCKQRLRLSMFYFKLPYRLLCRLFRGPRYFLTYVCGAALLAAAYHKQDLLRAKIPMLIHPVSTAFHNQLPRLGVVLAFVAFTLHRVIVHANHTSGGRCRGWLSRCAINMFNNAYGRQPPAQDEYELSRLGE